MPIAALPQTTAQAIGSTSVLSDASSVVKELLDNALDACASSVSIEISQNTLDIIQVKDNGYGISLEDHAMVCTRAYTSKIQTLEDLKNVGGQSLGFRGEALASVAEMAGALTLSTRVSSQTVGSLLKYDRRGELVSNTRVSHPVGTTVRVTDFLKHIPVRKQTALKNASKTLTKIKKVLQAYAIAKSSIRLSFKVLRSKNGSNDWIYASKPDAGLFDAALKVVGSEIAAQCIRKEWSEEESEQQESTANSDSDASSYRLVAFLPKSDADLSVLGSYGQFVSVDGRPVSTSRGTSKEIARLFKAHVRAAAKAREVSTSVTDPFLCLHIDCPKGSYDANIEPAKDDVLFGDPQIILSLAENLFRHVYGVLDDDNNAIASRTQDTAPERNDFNLLMASKPTVQLPASPPPSNLVVTAQTDPATIEATSIHLPTITPLSNRTIARDERGSSEVEGTTMLSDRNSANPWTIAKTHFFHRSSPSASQSRSRPVQLLTPVRQKGVARRNEGGIDKCHQISATSPLPSPTYSSSVSSSPLETSTSPLSASSSQAPPRDGWASRLNLSTKSARERAKERYGNGALDTWFKKTTQPSLEFSSGSFTIASRNERAEEGVTEGEMLLDELDLQNSEESVPEISNNLQKPFKLPVPRTRAQDQRTPDVHFGSLSGDSRLVEADDRRQNFPVLEQWSSILHKSSCQTNGSDVEDALDFERRKRAAILSRRERLKNRDRSAPSSSQVSNSPHQNRYRAARAALAVDPNTGIASAEPTGLPRDESLAASFNRNDPRAYFIRYQETMDHSTSGTGLKMKRVHTNRLPLEKTPDGFDIHHLGLRQSIRLDHLAASYRRLRSVDTYTQSGVGHEAFSSSDLVSISQIWGANLNTLLRQKYRATEGGGVLDMNFDLYTKIRAA